MANFIITTQKPNTSQLNASKSTSPGKRMEDAFDALMTNKQAAPARSVGEQDSRRHQQQQEHQHLADQQRLGKKTKQNASTTARQLAGQAGRAHTMQAHQQQHMLPMTPEQLIQRQMHDERGDSDQQRQQAQELEAISADESSEEEVSMDVVNEPGLFDDIDLGQAPEPMDNVSIHEMIAKDAKKPETAPRGLSSGGSTSGPVPGQVDQLTGAPVKSAEEAQLMAAAMDKKNDHYPQGSVGRALQDGKLDSTALHKLFEHWKAQRSAEQHRQQQKHARAIPVPQPKAMLQNHAVPDLPGQQGQQSQDEDESQTVGANQSSQLDKLYEYIKDQMIESVWEVKTPHGLKEGVVVNLKGDLVDGSRFHLQKVNNIILVSFYIENDQFFARAKGFEEALAGAIRNQCDVDEVAIRYHQLASTSSAQDMPQAQSLPNQTDDDLWG